MTNISAAIGLAQLKKLDTFNQKRRENAEHLTSNLNEVDGLETPYVSPDINHVFHQYTIKINDNFSPSRDEFAEYLKKKEIGFGVYYPLPIHRQPLFEKLGYTDEKVNCPTSQDITKKVISLPVHPGLTQNDLDYIVESVRRQEKWMSA